MQKQLGLFIWILTLAIIIFGLFAIYSASYQNIRVSGKVFYDQLGCAIMGMILMFLISRIDYRKFYDIAYVIYAVSILLLIFVLISGQYALGAQRWISIFGIRFQPSELTKLALILALGRYFSQRRPALSFSFVNFWHVLWLDLLVPLIITLVPMLLIFKQPDLGTSLLILGIFIFMLFVSGLEYRYILCFLGSGLFLMPFAWHFLRGYQKDRLLVFLNPNIDPLGAGYTIIQSKIAVGSGKLFGKGWMSGTQNQLNFLPERHTDFIFSVIGEEGGLVATIVLLTCYFLLILCSLKIAEQVKDKFGTQVAIGITAIFTLQATINMGMVLGLCPVVGLTLPLVSYGRTSFLIFVIMTGFLLNLSTKRRIF